MAEWQRTHTCGQLRVEHVGQRVTLNGWVHTTRSYNDQVFIDLRDRYGLTQVVVGADNADAFGLADKLGRESCLSVTGTVSKRLAGAENLKLATGEVEVKASEVRVLNACPTPPFSVTEFADEELANEDLRLQYRYLDLRRQTLQRTLGLRHRLCKAIRDHLDARDFLEIETPLLGRSTPEGARDYLVPSRVHEGQWYALPQSPQLYKQLLMVSGYDRYFQIARCLRDEDLRADRQPEFTQLDVEMSFVDVDDVLGMMEGLVAEVFRGCLGVEIPTPFERLPYAEVMARYGSDKPDLRYDLPIVDVTEIAKDSSFKVFVDAAGRGDIVRAINAKGAASRYSNTDLKPGGKLAKFAGDFGAKGLAWMKVEGGKFTGSIEKFFDDGVKARLRDALSAEDGDLLLFVADKESVVCHVLGALRGHMAEVLGLYRNWWDEKAEYDAAEEEAAKKEGRPVRPFQIRPEHFRLAWVVEFPMFMRDEEEGRWVALHHPFTSPREEDLDALESDPGRVRARAYDLVLNGYELGGGSIRIHSRDVQQKVFAALGMSEEDAKARFGFLLDALKFGAPPHGGIALGLDRFAMMLGGTTNIRDVIAFPKNQKARDLMTGAPAPVEKRQLRDLGLT